MTYANSTHSIATASHPTSGSQLRRGVRAIADAVTAIGNRLMVKRLGDLSSRELADIGLTRLDVSRALDAPLFADPSRELAGFAATRPMQVDLVVSVPSDELPQAVRGRNE